MEGKLQNPENSASYDFRKFDQIWKRVSPGLTPYVDAAASFELPVQTAPAAGNQQGFSLISPSTPSASSAPSTVSSPSPMASSSPMTSPTPLSSPPEESMRCCMGTAAGEMLQMLEGFIEDELSDQRYYTALCRQAPSSARQTIRAIARDEAAHARTLLAVCYLITGRCYQPSVSFDRIYIGPWCPALRERYHAETCGGLHYLRAAENTLDPCLSEILKNLSDDEYRHAKDLTHLLTLSMSGTRMN